MKYLIKAVSTTNFKPIINGNKNSFLGGETFTVCCGINNFGTPVIDATNEELRQLETLMEKPKGYLDPANGFWSDKQEPNKVNGEENPPLKYRHVVVRDSKGEDEGVVLETLDSFEKLDEPVDPEKLENTLLIKMLKNASGVAWNGELKYGAPLQVVSFEDMTVKKVQNKKLRNQASAKLEDLSIKEQRKYFTIIFNRDHNQFTDNQVYEKLADFIDENSNKAQTFLALLDDDSVNEKYKYTLLFNKDIITKENHAYHFQGTRLGINWNEVYNFLKEKKNQEIKHSIDKEFKLISND